jgi:hypothetical protein
MNLKARSCGSLVAPRACPPLTCAIAPTCLPADNMCSRHLRPPPVLSQAQPHNSTNKNECGVPKLFAVPWKSPECIVCCHFVFSTSQQLRNKKTEGEPASPFGCIASVPLAAPLSGSGLGEPGSRLRLLRAIPSDVGDLGSRPRVRLLLLLPFHQRVILVGRSPLFWIEERGGTVGARLVDAPLFDEFGIDGRVPVTSPRVNLLVGVDAPLPATVEASAHGENTQARTSAKRSQNS